jgi:excisionase family DNA binding protein
MSSSNVTHLRLVGTNIAAKRLHISERTVRYRASRGLLEAIRVGKLWKFRLDQFTAPADPAKVAL